MSGPVWDVFGGLVAQSGFAHLTWGQMVMWLVAFGFLYLAIARQFEPLLLLPIAFGMVLANLPGAGLMEPGEGLLWRFYHYGIQWEVIPPSSSWGWGRSPISGRC